jgi:hypothetical protein
LQICEWNFSVCDISAIIKTGIKICKQNGGVAGFFTYYS